MGHKSAPNCVTFVGAVEGIFLTGPKISPTVCVQFSAYLPMVFLCRWHICMHILDTLLLHYSNIHVGGTALPYCFVRSATLMQRGVRVGGVRDLHTQLVRFWPPAF